MIQKRINLKLDTDIQAQGHSPLAFDFDPQIPDLALAFDLNAITQMFERAWPHQDHHPPAIIDCHLQNIQYQPAKHCTTAYKLRLRQSATSAQPTFGVVENTPTGVKHRLLDDDDQLPGLRAALDAELMLERFRRLGHHPQIKRCEIRPIRYKPGSRCTLRYTLRTPTGEQVYFGKLASQHSDQLNDATKRLYQVSHAAPTMPRIARPVTYWPDLAMVVQAALGDSIDLNERAFDDSIPEPIRARWLRAAGMHLAAFHQHARIDGPQRTLSDDLLQLNNYHSAVTTIAPLLASQVESAIETIRTLSRGRIEPAPVPSHGALRTDQFMFEGERLALIDLDSFCWANPARDIGNFMAYLVWKAIRKPAQAAFIADAQQAFFDGYLTHQSSLDKDWLTLYQATSMLKIVGRRFRNLTYKEWDVVPLLLEAATTMLYALEN